jgi:putative spermidine/putrescine transport system permease protein
VLAQFGGVALAFRVHRDLSGRRVSSTLWLKKAGRRHGVYLWLYQWDKGLMLVYLYFQIPLMLIVFLPAVEGLRPQWREATETLGGTTWTYWRRIAGPILLPSFVGGDPAAVHQRLQRLCHGQGADLAGATLVPLQIAGTLSSEVILGQEPTSARRWRWRWSSSWRSS